MAERFSDRIPRDLTRSQLIDLLLQHRTHSFERRRAWLERVEQLRIAHRPPTCKRDGQSIEYLVARFDARVADIDFAAGDELLHLIGTLAAERALHCAALETFEHPAFWQVMASSSACAAANNPGRPVQPEK
jgi:hypothetical protein